MYYVYILSSTKLERLYIGRSDDLRTRFETHNAGKVKSTKAYRPWILVYYEAYRSKKDATKREIQLKNHAAKENIKMQIKNSLLD